MMYLVIFIIALIYVIFSYIRKIEFIIYRDDSDISGVEELDMALSARHTIYSNSFMDPFEYVK